MVMAENFDPTEWITTAEAADLTGYTARNIIKAIDKSQLCGVKRGGAWFLVKEEVQAYAEEMQKLGPRKHDPWRTGARMRNNSGEA
jgi:excisionase family DNA binding protein